MPSKPPGKPPAPVAPACAPPAALPVFTSSPPTSGDSTLAPLAPLDCVEKDADGREQEKEEEEGEEEEVEQLVLSECVQEAGASLRTLTYADVC